MPLNNNDLPKFHLSRGLGRSRVAFGARYGEPEPAFLVSLHRRVVCAALDAQPAAPQDEEARCEINGNTLEAAADPGLRSGADYSLTAIAAELRSFGSLRKFVLGDNDIARCHVIWRQTRLKRHLPRWLPDDADDFPAFGGDVIELVSKPRRLISDGIDSILLVIHRDPPCGLASWRATM